MLGISKQNRFDFNPCLARWRWWHGCVTWTSSLGATLEVLHNTCKIDWDQSTYLMGVMRNNVSKSWLPYLWIRHFHWQRPCHSFAWMISCCCRCWSQLMRGFPPWMRARSDCLAPDVAASCCTEGIPRPRPRWRPERRPCSVRRPGWPPSAWSQHTAGSGACQDHNGPWPAQIQAAGPRKQHGYCTLLDWFVRT